MGNGIPYSENVTIYTPSIEMFNNINDPAMKGIKLEHLEVSNENRRGYELDTDCHLINRKYITEQFSGYCEDIFIVAPLVSGSIAKMKNVKKMFPRATPDNTLFITEYQTEGFRALTEVVRGVESNVLYTGLGADRLGLLFDGIGEHVADSPIVAGVYSVIYIANTSVSGVEDITCALNFITMIMSKYDDKRELHFVVPKWLGVHIKLTTSFYNTSYARNATFIWEGPRPPEEKMAKRVTDKSIVFHCDIFPLSRLNMVNLIKYSLPDILVTGDQSVTDTIECGSNKIIWYQTLRHKNLFAEELAAELPQMKIAEGQEACGTFDYDDIDPVDSAEFIQRNDFRVKAKPVLDDFFGNLIKKVVW
jgi:hypothetical protein